MGGGKTNKVPEYTGLQLNTSAYGLVIPVRYGTTRAAAQLVWYGDFKANPQQSGGGKAGATGGGGKDGGPSSYLYSASFVMAMGEGACVGCNNLWISQTETDMTTQGLGFIPGTLGQAPWEYLQDNHPGQAVGYNNTCLIVGVNYNMGESAMLPNFNFELQGIGAGQAWNNVDARIPETMFDMLTSPAYGMGMPSQIPGSLQVVREARAIPPGLPPTLVTLEQFQYNLTVVNSVTGKVFKSVLQNPQEGEYIVGTNGEYIFSSADSGNSVFLTYASVIGWNSWANFCRASGLWVSPSYDTQSTASSLIDDLVELSYSEVVYSSGMMNVVPKGTVAVTGNGATYTPPDAPLFDLTNEDFQENSAPIGVLGSSISTDPVIVSRKRISDQINDVKLECLDRNNAYATAVPEWSDKTLIDQYGRRAGNIRSAHIFSDYKAAKTSVTLLGQDNYVLNTYSFTLDQRYAVLDPMDIVTLTEAQSGLNRQWVRIVEMQENDDGTISFAADEYPEGTGAAAIDHLNVGQGYIPNFNSDPGQINPPIIFEPPVQITSSNGLEVWAAVSGAVPASWGGCDVLVSMDGTTYKLVDTIHAPAVMGVLASSLPAGSDPDTTHSFTVDLGESNGTLSSGSQSDADNNNTLCYVDGEFISYETATLVGGNSYSLGTYLRRGQYGSAIGSHNAGTNFVRMNNFLVKVPISSPYIGETIYLKFPSFNKYSGGQESQADAQVYTHVIQGPPTQFVYSNLTASPGVGAIQLRWVNPSTNGLVATEIWMATTNNRASATKVADVSFPGSSYALTNLTQGTQYFFWVRGRDQANNETPYFPVSATGGISATASQAVNPGSLTPAAFAAGIQPITLVSGLPSPGTWTGTSLVFNILDGQLYRLFGGSWTLAVNVANLTGQLQAGQLAAGSVIAGNLAANSVTAGTVQVGAVSANFITSGTFTGLTFQTAASGQRTVISASTNTLQFFNSSNQLLAQVGGSSSIPAPFGSFPFQDSTQWAAYVADVTISNQWGLYSLGQVYAGQSRSFTGHPSPDCLVFGDGTGIAGAYHGVRGIGNAGGGSGIVGVGGASKPNGHPVAFYAESGAYGAVTDFICVSFSGGVLWMPSSYVASPGITATGFIFVKDQNGTSYKMLVST